MIDIILNSTNEISNKKQVKTTHLKLNDMIDRGENMEVYQKGEIGMGARAIFRIQLTTALFQPPITPTPPDRDPCPPFPERC